MLLSYTAEPQQNNEDNANLDLLAKLWDKQRLPLDLTLDPQLTVADCSLIEQAFHHFGLSQCEEKEGKKEEGRAS